MKINEFTKELIKEYHLPMMRAKMLFEGCKNYDEALRVLALTEENWSWSILDYRDSEELKNLRKIFQEEEKLVYIHWGLWNQDRGIPDYEIWKRRYLKGK